MIICSSISKEDFSKSSNVDGLNLLLSKKFLYLMTSFLQLNNFKIYFWSYKKLSKNKPSIINYITAVLIISFVKFFFYSEFLSSCNNILFWNCFKNLIKKCVWKKN